MACHDLISYISVLWDAKGNKSGIISAHIIIAACLKLPDFTLVKACKAVSIKGIAHIFDRIKGIRTFIQKMQQFFIYLGIIQFFHSFHFRFSVFLFI